MRPPPKREHGLGSLVPDINPNMIPNNLAPINQHNQHLSRSSKLVCLLERHNGKTMQPPRPPKRARTEGTSSTKKCKGNCPTVWTIVQYQTSTIFYSKMNLESVASQWWVAARACLTKTCMTANMFYYEWLKTVRAARATCADRQNLE